MKHTNIKYHYIREKITEGTLQVNEVDSKKTSQTFTPRPYRKMNTDIGRKALDS